MVYGPLALLQVEGVRGGCQLLLSSVAKHCVQAASRSSLASGGEGHPLHFPQQPSQLALWPLPRMALATCGLWPAPCGRPWHHEDQLHGLIPIPLKGDMEGPVWARRPGHVHTAPSVSLGQLIAGHKVVND